MVAHMNAERGNVGSTRQVDARNDHYLITGSRGESAYLHAKRLTNIVYLLGARDELSGIQRLNRLKASCLFKGRVVHKIFHGVRRIYRVHVQ